MLAALHHSLVQQHKWLMMLSHMTEQLCNICVIHSDTQITTESRVVMWNVLWQPDVVDESSQVSLSFTSPVDVESLKRELLSKEQVHSVIDHTATSNASPIAGTVAWISSAY